MESARIRNVVADPESKLPLRAAAITGATHAARETVTGYVVFASADCAPRTPAPPLSPSHPSHALVSLAPVSHCQPSAQNSSPPPPDTRSRARGAGAEHAPRRRPPRPRRPRLAPKRQGRRRRAVGGALSLLSRPPSPRGCCGFGGPAAAADSHALSSLCRPAQRSTSTTRSGPPSSETSTSRLRRAPAGSSPHKARQPTPPSPAAHGRRDNPSRGRTRRSCGCSSTPSGKGASKRCAVAPLRAALANARFLPLHRVRAARPTARPPCPRGRAGAPGPRPPDGHRERVRVRVFYLPRGATARRPESPEKNRQPPPVPPTLRLSR